MEKEIKRTVVRQVEMNGGERRNVLLIYLKGTYTAFTTNRDRNREEIEMKAVRQMESKGDEWRREKEHGTPSYIHLQDTDASFTTIRLLYAMSSFTYTTRK